MMKQTKIDFLAPFEKVRETVLSMPEIHKAIAEGAVRVPQAQFANDINHGPASKAKLEDVLRYLYEAAHGHQVATDVGTIGIAPSVAASLKESPFFVSTQVGLLLEALTRIISGALHSNTGVRGPQIAKKDVLGNTFVTKRKDKDEEIVHSGPFLRPKRPAFLQNR